MYMIKLTSKTYFHLDDLKELLVIKSGIVWHCRGIEHLDDELKLTHFARIQKQNFIDNFAIGYPPTCSYRTFFTESRNKKN